MSEEYSVGYDAGFQEGRNAAIDEFVTEISQLQAENAALKAELRAAEEKQGFCFACGNPITDPCEVTKLKAELEQEAQQYEDLRQDYDKSLTELDALKAKLAAAQKEGFRAGMLAAAEEAHKPNEYGFHRTCEEIYEAIREAAKK